MSVSKDEQFARMLDVCRSLDADVRYSKGDKRINILAWDDPAHAELARSVQQTLLQQSAQNPNIVCYCFDEFSTLIYAV